MAFDEQIKYFVALIICFKMFQNVATICFETFFRLKKLRKDMDYAGIFNQIYIGMKFA